MIAAALGATGCAMVRPEAAPRPALATVNGQALMAVDFDRFVTVKLGDFAAEPLDDAVRSELFDEFVKREITVQAAKEQGLTLAQTRVAPRSEDASPIVDEQQRDLLVQKYYQQVVLKGVTVTPDEIVSYYMANRTAYCPSEGFLVREIRVGSREEADRLRGEIAEGRFGFAEAAREANGAADASRVYDPAALPDDLRREVDRLCDGEVSPVVASKLGYHVFLRERCEGEQPLERVRDRVASDVRATKNERLVEAAVERLLERASVEVNRDQLSFHYEGRFADEK